MNGTLGKIRGVDYIKEVKRKEKRKNEEKLQ